MRMAVKIFASVFFIMFTYNSVKSILPPSYKAKAPFMAYIFNRDGAFCGGVILNEHVILSAAHCISSYMMATAGGSHLSDNTTQTVDIQSTFLHENYLQDPNGIQTYNDIGLLLLKNPFQFNSHIQRIELTNKIDFHRNVTVYGWGSTDAFVINRSEHLRAKNISLIPVDVCNKMLNEAITTCEKQIYEYCVEKSCCNGDSGGPVVQTIGNVTKLVGIISWGADDDISCDSEPHVFDSVGYFAKWIKNGIRTLLREKVSGSGDDQENFVKH